MHKLKMTDGTVYFYDQHTSKLMNPDGSRAIDFTDHPGLKDISHKPAYIAVSPEEPGRKTQDIHTLKIQLGLGCPESCAYCLQQTQKDDASFTNTTDAKLFVDNIHTWLLKPEGVQRVEIWGGEPLAYWAKIQVMMPKLKELFPNAQFTMITNGKLLSYEIIDQLIEWGFSISVSHDGPGIEVRGYGEPLDDPKILKRWHYAYSMMKSNFNFLAVLTPGNSDVAAIIDYLNDYFPNVRVGIEGVVHNYDESPSSIFTLDQLHDMSVNLCTQIITGSAARSPSIKDKMRETIDSFVNEYPSTILWQKCGMDMPDMLAVDLRGNVVTCQNVGAAQKHKIGDVRKFDDIRLNTSTHWSKRQMCVECPVLQMCGGSCMFQEGKGWMDSCNAEFFYNKAFWVAALYFLTGKLLETHEMVDEVGMPA